MVTERSRSVVEVSLTNWNAGGAHSISAIFNGKSQANYKSISYSTIRVY
ncbi:MAG: hypothetical protein HKP48_10165 [Winogradskyella sp.]|nr:hypothetical protein [Winogradskyella sp.]MBT8245367.1 DUF3078 domain-containing protein [Winogradskyella sp.]NNK23630.1 hypothetical protein [Winogradskyella sp.]